MKKCTQCGIEKSEDEFYKDKRLKSGLRSNCKICQDNARDNWRKNHPENVKNSRKKHYSIHKYKWQDREKRMSPEKREKKNEYIRNYRIQNKDELNRKRRERYKNVPEEEKRSYSQSYYDSRKERICELSRGYYKNLSPEDKQKNVQRVREWRQKNRDKAKAWSTVGNAIRRGEIVKPSKCAKCKCSGCLHAHHKDYSKPLEVLWICHKCHMKLHKDLRR